MRISLHVTLDIGGSDDNPPTREGQADALVEITAPHDHPELQIGFARRDEERAAL